MVDFRSIGQFIKRAVISLVDRDLGNYSIAQVQYNDKTGECELVSPYGLCAVPPKGSAVLLFNVMGQEENRAGIPYYPQIRLRGLKEGEVAIYNALTGAFIKMDQLGNINITSLLDINLAAPKNLNIVVGGGINIACTGNSTISGGGGNMYINDATVHLGGDGGQPIARVGDKVQVNGQTGVIVEGGSHFAT